MPKKTWSKSVVPILLKGYSTQKLKFCHHLLTLKLFQTCMSFFLLLNTQDDISACLERTEVTLVTEYVIINSE